MGLRRWIKDWLNDDDDETNQPEKNEPTPNEQSTTVETPSLIGQPGYGGLHPFTSELESILWASEQEAIAYARSNPDPDLWPGGQMLIPLERALAHRHESTRDRLADWINGQLSQNIDAMFDSAAAVVQARVALETQDRRTAVIRKHLADSNQQLADDPLELGRFYRRSDPAVQWLKRLLVFVLILTEFAITGLVFEAAIDSPLPNIGYVLALGVLVILITIPHYAANGLKEGLTRYHGFTQQWLEDRGQFDEVTPDMLRRKHHEEQDDRGFRIAACVTGLALIMMILPLSVLRSEEFDGGWLWSIFLFSLQFGLSGYFFLREWSDHGGLSSDHDKLVRAEAGASELEDEARQQYSQALGNYRRQAESYLSIAREAPRWDSYIVSCYWSTIHYVRHIIAQHSPELAPALAIARAPQPSNTDPIDGNTYALDPIDAEHGVLKSSDFLGRAWLFDQLKLTISEESESPSHGSAYPHPSLVLRRVFSENGLSEEYGRVIDLRENEAENDDGDHDHSAQPHDETRA